MQFKSKHVEYIMKFKLKSMPHQRETACNYFMTGCFSYECGVQVAIIKNLVSR